MEHKKIKVKGGIVHYWINRVEECQNCIVFSHGVTADHTMFEKQIAYYSKSDLWWLKQAAPMAKLFSSGVLRISMAWSVSKTKYSYKKMMSMLNFLC